jgi:alpha-tubulin suppressor-like RCC1 family protein
MKNINDSKPMDFHGNTLAAGRRHTVGIKTNGTVTAVGDNRNGQCDVSDWQGIQISGK